MKKLFLFSFHSIVTNDILLGPICFWHFVSDINSKIYFWKMKLSCVLIVMLYLWIQKCIVTRPMSSQYVLEYQRPCPETTTFLGTGVDLGPVFRKRLRVESPDLRSVWPFWWWINKITGQKISTPALRPLIRTTTEIIRDPERVWGESLFVCYSLGEPCTCRVVVTAAWHIVV